LTYTVGLPRGQPRLRLDQPSASKAPVRLAPPEPTFVEIPIGDAALQPHYDADYPSAAAYIQLTPGPITAEGDATEPSTEELLRGFMAEVGGFVQRVYTILPRRPGA
jgi:hypothetical protein